MNRRRCYLILFLLLLSLLAPSAFAEKPNFTRIAPDLPVYPEFFSLALDERRNLYVGGSDFVLRYDGGRWTELKLPSVGVVRAMHRDSTGKLWIGATDAFGYLETRETGEMRFVNLAGQFSKELQGERFTDIWRIHEHQGAVYFVALRHVFKLNAQAKKSGFWRNTKRFGAISTIKGELYLQWRGEGLRKWDGTDFVPVAGTGHLSKHLVLSMFGLPDGGILTHDVSPAFKIWRNGRSLNVDNENLRGHLTHLSAGLDLQDGNYAFGGSDGQLRILNLADKHIHAISIGSSYISDLIRDQDGAILSIDDGGVVRLDWPATASKIDQADGMVGAPRALQRVGEQLYIATTVGLLEATLVGGDLVPPIRQLTGNHEAWQILPVGSSLLVAESNSIARLNGSNRIALTGDDVYPRALRFDPVKADLLWVGSEEGPYLYRYQDSQLTLVGHLEDAGWISDQLVADGSGMWMNSGARRVYFAQADAKDPRGFTVQSWGEEKGLTFSSGFGTGIYVMPEGVYATTESGVFRFDKPSNRFIKDDFFALAELLGAVEHVILYLADNGDRWAYSFHSVYQQPRGGVWRLVVRAGPGDSAISALTTLPNGSTLVGSTGVLSRYRPQPDSTAPVDLGKVRVTAVRYKPNGKIAKLLALNAKPILEKSAGSLEFDLGLSDLRGGTNKQYQVKLVGSSQSWSDWSSQSSYSFLALPIGEYSLQTRARGFNGQIVDGEAFAFSVVPRWFEQSWILPLLTTLGVGLIAAFWMHRQRSRERVLQLRNQELNDMVRVRTRDLELMNLDLKDAADRDGLTGIANRRRLDQFLAERVALAEGRKVALGLALIDVDHFKRYNDTHGHQAGDEALRQVADCLARNVRGDTLAARYGGEEFVIVAPNCESPALHDLAQRLRSQIVELPAGVTVSIGTASLTLSDASTIATLFAQADAALYRAKQQGRNQVISEPD